MEVKETRKVESQCIRVEDGRLLRDKDFITQRWTRLFHSLLNAKKAEKLYSNITSKLPRQTMEANLGVEPMEGDIALALQAMTNSKAVGTEGLSAELLKLGLNQDRSILRELHRLITRPPGAKGKSHSGGKMPSPWQSTRRKTKPNEETTAGFLSYLTQAKCFSR